MPHVAPCVGLFCGSEKFSLSQPCGFQLDLEKSVCKNNKFRNFIFSENQPSENIMKKSPSKLPQSFQGEDLEILNSEAKGLAILGITICTSLVITAIVSAMGIF